MNLTTVKDKSEVMERHLTDSLAIIPPIRDIYGGGSLNLVDAVIGGGLPGLILLPFNFAFVLAAKCKYGADVFEPMYCHE